MVVYLLCCGIVVLVLFVFSVLKWTCDMDPNSALSLALTTILENMSDTTKKSKKHELPTGTVCDRLAIGANWHALLSSNMLNGATPKPEKPVEKFTGTFRRSRQKNKSKLNALPDRRALDITSSPAGKTVDETNLSNGDAKEHGRTDKKLTKVLAMDCEMVGIGVTGEEHMLARVSIVNRFGDCVYDKFVKAREEVTNYRTKISGVRKEDMLNGEDFKVVQREVSELLRGKILVGHSLKNDLAVLFLSHPKRQIRDTSKYKPFRKITRGNTPSLKKLAAELLGADIQGGEHSSVEDARAAMQLYIRVAKDWEQSVSGKRKQHA